MADLVHDTFYGQVVRYFTKGRLYGHIEDKPDFELPWKRLPTETASESEAEKVPEADSDNTAASTPPTTALPEEKPEENASGVDKDLELQTPVGRERSRVLQPQKTPDGVILVDWYTTDDPANPYNWSSKKKFIATFIISWYTFGVYSSSAIITPAHQDIEEKFNVSYAEASLGLAMYVIGYGIGPLVTVPSHISPP
jgi:MFS transporter, DHA1 family, multidrug resistance protein